MAKSAVPTSLGHFPGSAFPSLLRRPRSSPHCAAPAARRRDGAGRCWLRLQAARKEYRLEPFLGAQPPQEASGPQANQPDKTPEWTPPSDPQGPVAPPEYTPPGEPITAPRAPPEFAPPGRPDIETQPPGRSTEPAWRPIRPDIPESEPLRPLPPRPEPDTEEPEPLPSEPGIEKGARADGALLDEEEMAAWEIQDLNAAYVEYCRERFAIPGFVDIDAGVGGLPAVYLSHPNGSQLELYLHGATVTSWRKPDGRDLLYLRPGNAFDGQTPISGGIPLAFPQYGLGRLPAHGFLRNLHWSLVDAAISPEFLQPRAAQLYGTRQAPDPAPTVVLVAQASPETYQLWPHHFDAMYTVSLMEPDTMYGKKEVRPVPGGDEERWLREEDPAAYDERVRERDPRFKTKPTKSGTTSQAEKDEAEAAKDFGAEPVTGHGPLQLRCVLQIKNTGDKDMVFSAALQPHYAVRSLAGASRQFVRALGLAGKYIMDYSADPSRPRLRSEREDYLYFGEGNMDRVYVDAAGGDLLFCPGDRSHLEIQLRRGFQDLAAYSPAASQADASNWVALPTARVARPVRLPPGEEWVGEMVVRAHDKYWETPAWEVLPLSDYARGFDGTPPPDRPNMPPLGPPGVFRAPPPAVGEPAMQ